jgi:hypothetical protein
MDEQFPTDNQDTERLIGLDDAVIAAALNAANTGYLSCPQCGRNCQLGDATCPQCGAIFDDLLETEEDERTFAVAAQLARRSAGDGPLHRIGSIPDALMTVIFEIDNQTVILPASATTVVGRGNSGENIPETYLDLSRFDAREYGVSRHHARILRKDTLVYVVDMGSKNGTWLNGRRLLVNVERLLRDGDELQLGRLKLIVRYT